MRFSLIAATLAVATPILASPLVSRQEPNANCSAMAEYQFPSQASDFSNVSYCLQKTVSIPITNNFRCAALATTLRPRA